MNNQPYVKQVVENKISTIEFFHPSHNAMPSDVLQNLVSEINTASKNTEVKIIILKSGGNRTFCAGASFDELININDVVTGKKFFSGFANVINAMRKCNKLIIASVQGKAVGGGVGIAAAADYCLATKYAAIKLSELTIGIGPFVIEPAVTRKIGLSAMSQMTMNAQEFYNATWAQQHGLYANVFDTKEELEQAVVDFAKTFIDYNPEALLEAKKAFWNNTEHWDDLLAKRAEISGKLVLSEFTKEKLAQYK